MDFRLAKIKDIGPISIPDAMFAQLKQQGSINKNLTDVSSKLDNLSTNMSEPINPRPQWLQC